MVRRAGGDPVPGWLLRKRDHNLCFLEFFEGLKGNLFQAISALKLLAIGSSNKRLHKFSVLDTQHGGVAKMLALLKNEQATELPMHPRLCGAPRVCKL